MQLRKHVGVALTSILVVTLASTPSTASPSSESPARYVVPPFTDDAPTPRAIPSLAVEEAGRIINDHVQGLAHEHTGVRITGERSLTVSLPRGIGGGKQERAIRGLLARAGLETSVTLTFSYVKHNRAANIKAKAALLDVLASKKYEGQVTGIGSDPSLGVVVVYATENSGVARTELSAKFGDGIVFRRSSGAVELLATRQIDSAPHYGGAGYRRWNAEHTDLAFECSTAFPVTISGVTYQLTAGHCMPGSSQYPHAWAEGTNSTNSLYYFGNRYTTTVAGQVGALADGTQDVFGDWALLRGSTYAPRVYNCASLSQSCTSLGVGAVSWTNPVMGSQVCSSGRTTAQTCRLFVTDPDQDGWDAGPFNISELAVVRSDQNLDGIYDCQGWDHGDSGGAVYQSIAGRPGYVRALGNATYAQKPANGQLCYYGYTKLSGFKAWAPGATMPTL